MPAYLKEAKDLLYLAAPLILAQIAQASLGLVDTIMVGRLGTDALAAIALASSYYFTVFMIFMGVLLAVAPTVGQAIGADDKEHASRAVRQGLWLAAIMSVPALVIILSAKKVFLAMGQDPATVALGYGYLKALAWGILPALLRVALRSLLEGDANTKPIFWFSLVAVAINVLANYTLMFGKWGFPELGIVGTGIASSFVNYIICIALGIYIIRRYPQFNIFSKLRLPDFKMLKDLIYLGLPISMSITAEVSLFTAAAFLMGLIGKEQLAAHQIALQTASLTFMVALGLSVAISIKVGRAVGRKDYKIARLVGFVGIAMTALFMTFTALSFWFFPKIITSFYLNINNPANAEVVAFAISFLSVAAMFQLFDGLQVSATGALRGFKDTKIPMFMTVFAYWAIGLSGSILLAFTAGLGGKGLWFGLVLGLGVAAVLLNIRFFILSKRN